MPEHDLLVVGAGPAGLAAAIAGAQRGLSSVVLERRTPPLDKPCGEGLMPIGVRALRALGIELDARDGRVFGGIRFIDLDTMKVAEGRFDREAYAIRRTTLSERLLARARELGVELRFDARIECFTEHPDRVELHTKAGTLRGRVLIGADGLHSRIREQAGLQSSVGAGGLQRFGLRAHFVAAPWTDQVEVYWVRGQEAYVTPLGANQVGVAFLGWQGVHQGARFAERLAAFPLLAARLGAAPLSDPPRGAGPFRQRVTAPTRGRVALIGDAAGYIDALTGEGLSLAFIEAEILSEVIAGGRPLTEYQRRLRRATRTHRWLTELMLRISRSPRLRQQAIGLLSRTPRLFSVLLRLAGG